MKSIFSNKILKITLISFSLVMLLVSGCKKDDDDGHNHEQELITTINFIVSGAAVPGGSAVFQWSDIDGEGGNAPVIDTIRLAAESSFTYDIEVLDESKTPAEDITEEIMEEDEDHLFLFNTSGPAGLIEVTADDLDDNVDPVGLTGTVQSGQAGTGTLNIILKHEPDKDNPVNTGETDVDITFPVVIE